MDFVVESIDPRNLICIEVQYLTTCCIDWGIVHEFTVCIFENVIFIKSTKLMAADIDETKNSSNFDKKFLLKFFRVRDELKAMERS